MKIVWTIDALRQLLLVLHDQQRECCPIGSRRRRASATAQDVMEELTHRYLWQGVTGEDLDRLLPSGAELHVDFRDERSVLFLPPLEKDAGFVPALSLRCRLEGDVRMVRLRVALVCRDTSTGHLQMVGFRMETPECQNGENEGGGEPGRGMHDYHHAQFITSVGMRSEPATVTWLPRHLPAFALVADDPITLCLSLIVALYGKKYFEEFTGFHRMALRMVQGHVDRVWKSIQWSPPG